MRLACLAFFILFATPVHGSPINWSRDYTAEVDKEIRYACVQWVKPQRGRYRYLEARDPMSCESRDLLKKAFQASSVVVGGISFVCKYVPHPYAQVTARVFEGGGVFLGTVSFIVEQQDCKKNDEQSQLSALSATCSEFRAAGVNCVGVGIDNSSRP